MQWVLRFLLHCFRNIIFLTRSHYTEFAENSFLDLCINLTYTFPPSLTTTLKITEIFCSEQVVYIILTKHSWHWLWMEVGKTGSSLKSALFSNTCIFLQLWPQFLHLVTGLFKVGHTMTLICWGKMHLQSLFNHFLFNSADKWNPTHTLQNPRTQRGANGIKMSILAENYGTYWLRKAKRYLITIRTDLGKVRRSLRMWSALS